MWTDTSRTSSGSLQTGKFGNDIKEALREGDAEIGIAYDGDGDRLGVVTKDGEVISRTVRQFSLPETFLPINPAQLSFMTSNARAIFVRMSSPAAAFA